jgi:hypothetical protein
MRGWICPPPIGLETLLLVDNKSLPMIESFRVTYEVRNYKPVVQTKSEIYKREEERSRGKGVKNE